MKLNFFKTSIIALIIFIFFVRILYSVPNMPTLDTDAVFSVEAAQSIIKTGIPIKNITGQFYDRDLLAHYILAGSIFLFGDNNIGYIIPSMFFSVLVLILIYLLGRKITNNKLVIFLSVMFVGISGIENTYAINPRSYMQFQFFFLLTILFFYKGFIEKNKKHGIITIFLYLFTILSHYSGIILAPILSLYLLATNKNWYKKTMVLTFITIVIIFSYIVLFVNQSTVVSDIVLSAKNVEGKNGSSPVGMSFILHNYILIIFTLLPLLSVFIFVGTFFVVKNKNVKQLYFYYIFWSSLFLISIFSTFASIKYFLFIFPLLTLLSLDGINKFTQAVVGKQNSAKIFFLILLSLFSLIISTNHISFKSYFTDYSDIISYISKNKQPKDIIICTDPTICLFYLNKCDYFLRQYYDKKNKIYTKLSQDYKNQYTINFIDNIYDLKNITKHKRTWIILDKKIFINKEITEYIEKNAELIFTKNNKT